MADYSYSVVRYYADPIKDEPVNVGLVMHSAADEYLAYRFDLRRAAHRLLRIDKDVFGHYETQLEAIENEDVEWTRATFENVPVSSPDFLAKVSDYLGNKIRFEQPRGCVSDQPEDTFDGLFSQFVSTERSHIGTITKRTLVREIKEGLRNRGVGEYVKSKPVVHGVHRNYTLPLGIRQEHRTFVEALRLAEPNDAAYRSMAAVSRLWQDARTLQSNRQANLLVLVHYAQGRLRDGERLLQDDGIGVFLQPQQLLGHINVENVRQWD